MEYMEYVVLVENTSPYSHRGMDPRPYNGGGEGAAYQPPSIWIIWIIWVI